MSFIKKIQENYKVVGVYRAGGAPHSGSSGFINFMPGTPEGFKKALTEVFTDHPNAVVIDGKDDWNAPKILHPDLIAKRANIKIIDEFHSGVSGISTSGIIINSKDFKKFKESFKEMSKDESLLEGDHPFYRRDISKECYIGVYKPDGSLEKLSVKCKGYAM